MSTKTETTKITSEFLVQALDDLGGSATTEQLKNYFDISNGSRLAGARRAAVNRGWVDENKELLSLVPQKSMVGRAPNHKPNARDLGFETFIDALINLGGQAEVQDLKEYFDLDTGNRLSGVRHATIKKNLVEYRDGKYVLVDNWSQSSASSN